MSFQSRAAAWALMAFGRVLTYSRNERNERFLEESLELVQSLGMPRERAERMVAHVYGDKTPGEPSQELGGVMVTLAVLCAAHDLDMTTAGETELLRCHARIDQIREKNLTKEHVSD